jgi:hypothetical protein
MIDHMPRNSVGNVGNAIPEENTEKYQDLN